MVLVLVVAALALVVTIAIGAGRLAGLQVRAVRLLVAAAAIQTGTTVLVPSSAPLRVTALVLSALLVALFLGGNWALTGIPLVAAGLLLNGVVVAVNQAMPVSLGAVARAGLTRAQLHLADDPLHEPAGATTSLTALGDTIPVVLPWRPQVVSPGDVLVASGVALLLVVGAPRRPARGAQKRVERRMVLASESTTRGSYS